MMMRLVDPTMSSGLDSPIPTQPEATPDDDPIYFNSEFILFLGLFIILCFLVALIALNAASRCSWLRRINNNNSNNNNNNNVTVPSNRATNIDHLSLPAAKLLKTIPKVIYSSAAQDKSDCAICLSEFVAGDEIRILPRCEHCFHVACVDRWIGSHFTCPSCRQLLLKTTRCDRCIESTTMTAGETSHR